jgi:hypothetical protein
VLEGEYVRRKGCLVLQGERTRPRQKLCLASWSEIEVVSANEASWLEIEAEVRWVTAG